LGNHLPRQGRNHLLCQEQDTGGFLKPDQLLKEFSEILEQAALPHLLFHDLRKVWWRALCARFQARKDGSVGTQVTYLGLDEDIYPW